MKDKSMGIIPFFEKNNQTYFLLIKQVAGHWAFPKGHPVENESEIETAKRELYEETGVASTEIIDNFRYSENYTFKKDDRMYEKEVIFFLGKTSKQDVQIQKEEVQNFAWLTFNDAIERLTFKESKQTLTAANNYINRK